MKIWYEIDDALNTCVDEQEAHFHGDCRYEVWEWCNQDATSEASLVGRFASMRLAESCVEGLKDQLETTGRGAFFPKDALQSAYDRFFAADPSNSTFH